MQKVITMNLNGKAFQLEETAYERLRTYLEEARAQLQRYSDSADILGDLEQAIADKCTRQLTSYKNVVTTAEVEDIIRVMGPVDAGDGAPAADAAPATASSLAPARRLFRLKKNAVWSGVCAGLAAYFDLDVVLVRILVVILTFLTGGVVILGYILAIFMIPKAKSESDIVAAHGQTLRAQDLIGRAKPPYDNARSSAQ